jgi:hypothetical protein
MKAAFSVFVLFLAACSGAVRDRDVPKADTLSPYTPPRDSGLQPKDSSAYHPDTSTQHTMF